MRKLKDKYNRTPEQIQQHYEVEKELAARLRNSTKEERKTLYSWAYDRLYQSIDSAPLVARKSNEAARAWVANQRMELLQEFLTPETTYVEVGPGDCCVSMEVAKHVKQVYAVDVSQEITQDLTFPDNLKLIIFDGCNVPLPENSADIVYSNQVIEHLHPDDALEQIKSIYKVLNPRGGVYVCITPHRLSGPHDISQYFDEIATCFHLKEYTIAELYEMFCKAGFSQVYLYKSRKTTHFKIPLNPATLSAIKILENTVGMMPFDLRQRVAKLPLLFRGITMVGIKS
jgi:SAM-dependent methyltransferase